MSDGVYKKVREDFHDAFKLGRKFEKDTLAILIAELNKVEVMVNGVKTVDDIVTLKAVRDLIKAENERHNYALKINSDDKLDIDYIDVLKKYLPTEATEEDITKWIKENIDPSIVHEGRTIGIIMKHFGTTTNGNVVKSVIKKHFQ